MANEEEELARLRQRIGGDGLHGPGDDAALFGRNGDGVITTDSVLEDVHYERGTDPAAIAHKLLHRNLSDLAAMGARPRCFVLAACFRNSVDSGERERFYEALQAEAQRTSCAWVGGDLATQEGPSVLTVTAIGDMEGRRPLVRSGLREGDRLFVTGPLGQSLESGWHLRFEARVEEGLVLAREGYASAAMDLSDGLSLDLSRMLLASGNLGAEIDADALPLRQVPEASATERALESALSGGEDYELLFGVPEARLADFEGKTDLAPSARRCIGVVTKGPGLVLRQGSERTQVPRKGFEHGFG